MSQRERMIAQAKKTRKRRERKPVADYQAPVELKIKRGAENRTIDRYKGVLLSIESALADAYSHDSRVDDEVVAEALRCAIRRQPSQLPAAREICREINDALATHAHLLEENRLDCLRTVYASVQRHSDCRNGSVNYLRFVAKYVN